ncbi:MAG: hypothetical protein ACI4PE_04730 [Bacilli bacterium]
MGANGFLLTILLVLVSVLVVFLIVISIKLLYTVDKINVILDDTEKKLKSVNGVFTAIDTVTDSITLISETVIGKVLTMIEKIFKKKK